MAKVLVKAIFKIILGFVEMSEVITKQKTE